MVTSNMDFNGAVAAELRGWRARRQITIDELAEASGLNRATVMRYLKAQREIPMTPLFQLAAALGTTAAEILKEAEANAVEYEATAPPIDITSRRKGDVGGSTETDLHTAPFTGREAATRGNTPVDPERGNA